MLESNPCRYLLVTLIFFIYGCSHHTPFIRSDVAQPDPIPQKEDIRYRLILIGDAGKPKSSEAGDPVLNSLTDHAGRLPGKTAVVFLGDNVYEDGVPAAEETSEYKKAIEYLDAQLAVLKRSGALGFFVPGNHDWLSGHPGGRKAILRQERIIKERGGGVASLLPKSGCPGPVAIDLDVLRIILVDSQWWLHPDKDREQFSCWPEADDGSEGGGTGSMRSLFADSLASLVAESGGREVVVVSHHPLASYGPHGGFYDWKMYLLPFPLVLPFAKKVLRIGAHQDLSGNEYRQMSTLFARSFAGGNRPLLLAAGHEHSLQVLAGGGVADFILVSGAGSQGKITPVTDGAETLFALSHAGYMVVDFINNGRILLQVFAVDGDARAQTSVFSFWLK